MTGRVITDSKRFPPPNPPIDSPPELKAETKAASRVRAKPISVSSRPAAGPREDELAARQQAPTAVQPVEPEDAYLTGVSRSLQRRLLGLNVNGPQGQSKPHPEATAAGLHATGSFTGTDGARPKEPAKRK